MALNISDDPNYWQNRAEEAWSVAKEMTDAQTRTMMVNIARNYEKIALWVAEQTREPR